MKRFFSKKKCIALMLVFALLLSSMISAKQSQAAAVRSGVYSTGSTIVMWIIRVKKLPNNKVKCKIETERNTGETSETRWFKRTVNYDNKIYFNNINGKSGWIKFKGNKLKFNINGYNMVAYK
ncbi:MAG: hypothetical protein IKQ97_02645 [Eubacterium sp.]|nr:hypothetical protein [Eubacterium sp.]